LCEKNNSADEKPKQSLYFCLRKAGENEESQKPQKPTVNEKMISTALAGISLNERALSLAGVVNIARDVEGGQIGVVNIARSNDYPVGLVNIIKEGEMAIGSGYNETGTASLNFRSDGGAVRH
jgi:hypothetical protein